MNININAFMNNQTKMISIRANLTNSIDQIPLLSPPELS